MRDLIGLHEWVERYNWNDGLAPMWPIVDWPHTELATALRIYWLLGGPYLEAPPGSVNEEAVRLRDLVQERILAGFYPRGSLRCDPTEGLSRVQVYQLKKQGLPAELLTPRWEPE